jgi:opacity protein-like surface antigen
MVKMAQYCLAFAVIIAFAAPVFAQDDYPRFQLTPGYGNVYFHNPTFEQVLGLPPGRHSGFTLDTNYNLSPVLGIDLFTGYYSLGNGSTLYTNTFGATGSLRKNAHIVPYGTAGFGFGSIQLNSVYGSIGERAMAARIGGGVDIPFSDSLALRVDATRLGFHFEHSWNGGMNVSVGVVLNLSQ